MRRTLALLAGAAAAAALAVAPAPVAADPPPGCPDDFVLVPAFLTQGRGDDNRDGVVCGKPAGDRVVGGPKPHQDAELVVIEGEPWWILDNVY
ncbi:MAG TPA: hypothetical protein VGW75_13580 [Solirubrobacteraceae bacterium]|jgi:hypothetical protein|nr:hypothetical protein [Solirubrobacteraceae bacterium]